MSNVSDLPSSPRLHIGEGSSAFERYSRNHAQAYNGHAHAQASDMLVSGTDTTDSIYKTISYEQRHWKKRPSKDGQEGFQDLPAMPKPTKLSRQSAIYRLSRKIMEDYGVSLDASSTDDLVAVENEFVRHEQFVFCPRNSPQVCEETVATDEALSGLEKYSSFSSMEVEQTALQKRSSSVVSVSPELGIASIALDSSHDSSLGVSCEGIRSMADDTTNTMQPCALKTPSPSSDAAVAPSPTTDEMLEEGSTFLHSATKDAFDYYTTASTARPSRQPIKAATGCSTHMAMLQSKTQQKQPPVSIPSHKPAPSTSYRSLGAPASSKEAGKCVSFRFPNDIHGESNTAKPVSLEIAKSVKTHELAHRREPTTAAKLMLSPQDTFLAREPTVWQTKPAGRRFSYPVVPPPSTDGRITLFPKRNPPRLYPCLSSIESPGKSPLDRKSFGEAKSTSPMKERRHTLWGTRTKNNLLDSPFDTLNENSAFAPWGNRSFPF